MNDQLDEGNRGIPKEYEALLFSVRRSVRYHSRRIIFFERWNKVVVFVSLIFSSATIAAFSNAFASDGPTWMKLLPAVLVSVLTALDLIIGSSQKARLHDHLAREFVAMERSLVAGSREPTEALIDQVTDQRLRVEATEPPVLRVLDVLCHNELMLAMGYDLAEHVQVSFWQRLCASFFDVGVHKLQSRF